jgi:nitrogen regulatory protein PII
VEVEDASLIMVGKLFSWTLDVSTATVDSTVVISSSGVDENLVSLVNPIVLDEFFVKSSISVTISSPVVDGAIEGIAWVLFTSFIFEGVIEDEMVSVTTVDSNIFGVSASRVMLNCVEIVDLFEILNVSVVALSAICIELVISKDVSFGRSVVELYSVEIKLVGGDETILFSVGILSCIVDEIVGDDEVKMMGAVKFSGVEVKDVSLLIVETLYSLLVDVSTTSVEISGSTSSVIVGVNVASLVDLVPLDDWRSFETDGPVEVLPPIATEASVDVELKLVGTVKCWVIFSMLDTMEVKDASLLVVGKLFLWTLDVSTVEFTVVTLSRGVDENIGSLINPVLLDDFFVETDISVTISSPVVDGVMEGISSVLFTSFIFEGVIADKMVSITTADSDIFGVSATNVVLNGAEFVELFELLNVSVVVLSAICVELVTNKDVSFGCSVVALNSVKIKLIVGDETILFSVEMLS